MNLNFYLYILVSHSKRCFHIDHSVFSRFASLKLRSFHDLGPRPTTFFLIEIFDDYILFEMTFLQCGPYWSTVIFKGAVFRRICNFFGFEPIFDDFLLEVILALIPRLQVNLRFQIEQLFCRISYFYSV